ncbi:MAG: helix-turn-helix domain-containing protein [Candidatus Micrarchaeota archaeon]
MRPALFEKVALSFNRHGFSVSSFNEFNSCFDLAARKQNEFFLVKVLENADGFREENCQELQKIAGFFGATPLLIAEKTKSAELVLGVVYERYSVPVLSGATLDQMLSNQSVYQKSFRGTVTVELDSRLLKQKRKQTGFSLEELANQIGASSQTIHRYEQGRPADLDLAHKLETILQTPLIRQVTISGLQKRNPALFDESFSNPVLEKIHDLGLNMIDLHHSPFRAIGKPREPVLINLANQKKDATQKAIILEKTRNIFHGHGVVISKETVSSTIHHTPVIAEEELESYTKIRQLLEEIKNREDQPKKKK